MDRSFPGWQLIKFIGVRDSVNLDATYGYSNFYACDLNSDSATDYAVAISVESDTNTVEYFIALLSTNGDFSLFTLATRNGVDEATAGRYAIYLARKGTQIPDFDQPDSVLVTFETDAITYFPLEGCCSTTYVFQHGQFRGFTSGD
ncbi:MAG: hypothetical protein WB699_06865 [Bacteroidota bacterium]